MKQLVVLALMLSLALSTSITSPQLLVELQARTENVIDDGVDLLEQLLATTEQQYEQVIQENEAEQQQLKDQVASKEQQLYDLQNTCMVMSDDLALLKQQIELHGDDTAYFRNEIIKDNRRIEVLEELRCQQSKNWLNFIKSSKYILNLIEFLRRAIQNYGSFAEIQNFSVMLETLSREVDDNELLNSLQAVSKSRAITPVRQELLQLLDQIEESIKAKINTSQTDEILSTSRIADYLHQLKQEIAWYENEVAKLNEAWGDSPEETVKQRQKELDTCESGINAKIEEAKEFRNHVSEQIIHNESRQARFLEQKDLVAQLIVEYQNAFNKIGETYKIRIDDYVEDGVFDKTVDFDKRSLTDLYGDKENNFEQYVDDLVSGVATPVEVPVVEEDPELSGVFEGGSESESEEAESAEEVEETVTEGTQESATEEVVETATEEPVETTTQPEVETTNEETNHFEQGEVQQSV
ncbi:unnamed protein product (macronuclear) [Paramecium tetraurelia]|uniref:Uncharacterized protein n=1 Tax=Paramecium tetraurelia TaxID=5888 RepID=A0BLV1_PARTE|nr:uncharacterized protein GSPATT00030152001 [Paramecium tetraurelia]CAK59518.1 unnamed protein product [Paramecium tetraurelia]|eukprot:XP_001426916.1 hypothetical protein (macronuclear) [Paramecium tetraurelia strain d4-2]